MHHSTRLLAASAFLAASAAGLAAESISVSRETTVDSSPATVWKLVGDFNALDVWHPAVARSTASGGDNKTGATRVLTLGDGAKITEKLLARDAAKHSYSYSILKSPLPVKNYRSTIRLSPTADGRTLMVWSSIFDAEGAPDGKAAEVIQGIYDAGLAKVAGNFKK
jgi:mxaD protein